MGPLFYVATLPTLRESYGMKSTWLVATALEKIGSTDHSGYELKSVLALASDSMARAAEFDKSIDSLPLEGIPILVKDNIEAVGLPATAGSLALADTAVTKDSTIADRLRKAGAVIIGATNLSEWANIRSDRSTSGWSAVGGLTANPWKHAHSAGGSSSGSGAAVAADLTQWAVGSETDGSIICPASLNGCVGIKPTVGTIPRDGMIPISKSQDTPGPMTQTVAQAALLLDVLTNQSRFLSAAHSHTQLRFGVVNQWMTLDDRVNALFEDSVNALSKQGAKIIRVDLIQPSQSNNDDELNVMLLELVTGLTEYLALRPRARVRDLRDILNFNSTNADLELSYFGQELFEKALDLDASKSNFLGARERNLSWANQLLDTGLTNVDVLLGCTYGPAWVSTLGKGDDFGSASWITTAPAVAGTPIGTVPMGLVDGLPVGIGLVVGRNQDEILVNAMAQVEIALNLGVMRPTFIK